MNDLITNRTLNIFLPYYANKRVHAISTGQRFAHYTSADSAMKLLKHGEVWLRKSSVMNDFSEIEYGLARLTEAWQSPTGLTFRNMLNEMFVGSTERIDTMFNSQLPQMRFDTYLTCISEHDVNSDENNFGRLSMWRAYGNIAVILNPSVFMSTTTGALQAYSNPVDYHTPRSFQAAFDDMVGRFAYDRDFLKAQGEETIWQWVVFMMRQFVLCTKHKGFEEEREWRVIHEATTVSSPLIAKEIETIKNVTQPVVKLKLQNHPELAGHLDIPNFVERIIIGPTQYPMVQREAFATLLQSRGVLNPYDRIAMSDIPLRQ